MLMDSYESGVLSITLAADLAKRRLERNTKLNATEARAIIISTLIEYARDGESVKDILEKAKGIIRKAEVIEHTEKLLHTIRFYAQFSDGRYLIVIRDPIS